MAHRPVRGEALGSSECSFAEAGRLLHIFLAARKELIMDAPDTFAQLLAVRQSLQHLGGTTTAGKQADSRNTIRTAAQPSSALKTPSGRTAQTEAGKARDPLISHAGEGSAAAEALDSPASLEQQRKDEKRRRKEDRRRQKDETRGRDSGAPPMQAAAAAQTVAAGEAELKEEERRREEKRLRKEERRRKREAAANGVKAGDGEASGLGGGVKASVQKQGVSQGVAGEEEERRRAKEEKRRRKEEKKRVKELAGSPNAAALLPVSAALVEAASTKRPAEEVNVDQKHGQKRAKVDTPQVSSKRPREEANGLQMETPVGKKQRGEETPKSSAQPNGAPAGMVDEEAARKEEKRRRKEEKRRTREAAAAAEQPLGDAIGKVEKGTGKREREEGPASEAGQVSKKQRQVREEKATGKRSGAQVDGLEARGGSSKKQRKEGVTGVVPMELNDGLAGGEGEKGGKSKEERKRKREAMLSPDASQPKAGALTKGAAADESKKVLSEEESREQKKARKEQKKGRQLEASGIGGAAAIEQRSGAESDSVKGQSKQKEHERGSVPIVDGLAVAPPSNNESGKKKKRKMDQSR